MMRCPSCPFRVATASEIAIDHYHCVPDWIAALAAEVERTTTARSAKRFKLSPAAVTRILTKQPEPFYRREQVEADVRAQLMMPDSEAQVRSLLSQLKQRSEAANV